MQNIAILPTFSKKSFEYSQSELLVQDKYDSVGGETARSFYKIEYDQDKLNSKNKMGRLEL